MTLLLALLLQVGPNPAGGALAGDDLVRDRPQRPYDARDSVNPGSAWLEACFAQIEDDPARAHAMAQIRRGDTKGADRVLANHCLGTAASALGLWDDARTAFLAARAETPADEARARARFGALAGNAALAGGDAEGALTLLAEAEGEARAAGADALEAIAAMDRARALVTLRREAEALAALEAATTRAPERAEGWLLKATLLRRLSKLAEAQTAIERAASLAPANPEIGLEAGVIAILAGREGAALQSWDSVVALQPDSPAAQIAAAYLAQVRDAPPPPPPFAPPPAPSPAPSPQPQQEPPA